MNRSIRGHSSHPSCRECSDCSGLASSNKAAPHLQPSLGHYSLEILLTVTDRNCALISAIFECKMSTQKEDVTEFLIFFSSCCVRLGNKSQEQQ